MNAMDPCPFDKRGRHELMAFFSSEGDTEVPVTCICTHCGMSAQYAMNWSTGAGSLDDRSPAEIKAAVDGNP